MVIDAELGREDHRSIPRSCDREGAEITWCQNWSPNQIMWSSGPDTGGEKKNYRFIYKQVKHVLVYYLLLILSNLACLKAVNKHIYCEDFSFAYTKSLVYQCQTLRD
jgi:hypothetical protein